MTVFISVDSDLKSHFWWKDLFLLYAKEGDSFEIHCWSDETEQIHRAEYYGCRKKNPIPDVILISGAVTKEWIQLLTTENKPEVDFGYNKMTSFYTVRVGENFSSEQYGTELLLVCDTDAQLHQVKEILSGVKDQVKFYINN